MACRQTNDETVIWRMHTSSDIFFKHKSGCHGRTVYAISYPDGWFAVAHLISQVNLLFGQQECILPIEISRTNCRFTTWVWNYVHTQLCNVIIHLYPHGWVIKYIRLFCDLIINPCPYCFGSQHRRHQSTTLLTSALSTQTVNNGVLPQALEDYLGHCDCTCDSDYPRYWSGSRIKEGWIQ